MPPKSVQGSDVPIRAHYSLSRGQKGGLLALAVGGVAGIVIIGLGGAKQFGMVGGKGFIASISSGGVSVLISAGGGLWVITHPAKKSSPPPSEDPPQAEPPPSKSEQEPAPPPPSKKKVEPAPAPKKKEKKQKLARTEEEQRRYAEGRAAFYQVASDRMLRKPIVHAFQWPDEADQGLAQKAKESSEYFYDSKGEAAGSQKIGGGIHKGLSFADSRIVFKLPAYCGIEKEKMPGYVDGYVAQAERARVICQKHNLDFLYVPQCRRMDCDGRAMIMQERAELLYEDDASQKACYDLLVTDPYLKDYAQELFRQIEFFILEMGMSDIKVDNLKLTTDGRVALYDLDENGALAGLRDRTGEEGSPGFFSLIPYEWFPQYLDLAKEKLSPNDFAQLEMKLAQKHFYTDMEFAQLEIALAKRLFPEDFTAIEIRTAKGMKYEEFRQLKVNWAIAHFTPEDAKRLRIEWAINNLSHEDWKRLGITGNKRDLSDLQYAALLWELKSKDLLKNEKFHKLIEVECNKRNLDSDPDFIALIRQELEIRNLYSDEKFIKAVRLKLRPENAYLDEQFMQELEATLPQKIQEAAQKEKVDTNARLDRYNDKGITEPDHPLVFDKKHFTDCTPEVAYFAQLMFEECNRQIFSFPLFSLKVGRSIDLDINSKSAFYQAFTTKYPVKAILEWRKIKKEALQILQAKGYIESYNYGQWYSSDFFSVVC